MKNISSLAVTNRKQVTSLTNDIHSIHTVKATYSFPQLLKDYAKISSYHRTRIIRGIRCRGSSNGLYGVRFPSGATQFSLLQCEHRLCGNQPPVQWVRKDSFHRVMGQRREADHRPSNSAGIKIVKLHPHYPQASMA